MKCKKGHRPKVTQHGGTGEGEGAENSKSQQFPSRKCGRESPSPSVLWTEAGPHREETEGVLGAQGSPLSPRHGSKTLKSPITSNAVEHGGVFRVNSLFGVHPMAQLPECFVTSLHQSQRCPFPKEIRCQKTYLTGLSSLARTVFVKTVHGQAPHSQAPYSSASGMFWKHRLLSSCLLRWVGAGIILYLFR